MALTPPARFITTPPSSSALQASDHLEVQAIAAAFPNCNRLRVSPTAHDVGATLNVVAAALPALQILLLSGNDAISDDDMAPVGKLTALRELDLRGCRKVRLYA